jgi:hypothetical protein
MIFELVTDKMKCTKSKNAQEFIDSPTYPTPQCRGIRGVYSCVLSTLIMIKYGRGRNRIVVHGSCVVITN